MERGKILEGFWDCNYCGTTRIGGSTRQCPNCGKARGDDITFYLDPTKNRYVPTAQADKINRNPDWICDYCDQLNSDNDTECLFCGAPRTDENLNYFQNKERQRKTQTEALPKHDYSYDKSTFSFDEPRHTSSNSTRNYSVVSSVSTFFAKAWKPMLIVFLVAISIIGMFLLFQPKEYELTVNELSWERCINVERFQTVKESNWSLPSGGRLLYTREEYSHSEQVLDHYETRTRQVAKERISGYETYVTGYRDLGNGYFEEITAQRPIYETYYETETYQEPVYRSEPVYRTKYYYEIDKWFYERSVTTKGTDKSPYWGEVILSSNERISSQTDTYYVKGTDLETEEEISFLISFEDWSTLEVGEKIKVEISFNYGKILE